MNPIVLAARKPFVIGKADINPGTSAFEDITAAFPYIPTVTLALSTLILIYLAITHWLHPDKTMGTTLYAVVVLLIFAIFLVSLGLFVKWLVDPSQGAYLSNILGAL